MAAGRWKAEKKKGNYPKPPYSSGRFDRDRPAACHGHLLAGRKRELINGRIKKKRKEGRKKTDKKMGVLWSQTDHWAIFITRR